MTHPSVSGRLKTLRALQTLLLLLVCAVLVGYWAYTNLINPAPFYLGADPEYLHTFNSLGPFRGQEYLYIHPPGTPLNVIGTALYAATYPFIGGSSEAFAMYHMRHPEVALLLGRGFLLVISLMCIVLFARYAIKLHDWVDVLASVAIPVSFFAINPLGFRPLGNWSHNSVAFGFGALLLLGLLRVAQNRAQTPRWHIAMLGFWAGILTSFQLYFATWVIGMICTLGLLELVEKRWRGALVVSLTVGVSSLVGFFVGTLPSLSQYPRFFEWVISLISSQGLYGQGEPGFISADTFSNNLRGIVQSALPMTLAILGLALLILVLFLWRRKTIRQNIGLWAVVFGLTIQSLVTGFLIVKHPRPEYLGGFLAVVPVLLAVCITGLNFRSSGALALRMGLAIGLMGLFVRQVDQWVGVHHRDLALAAQIEADVQARLADYAQARGKQPAELQVLWGYGAWSQCSALLLGNDSINRVFTPEVQALCPNDMYLNVWGRTVVSHTGGVVALDEYPAWDAIITVQPIIDIDAPYLKDFGYHVPSVGDTVIIFAANREIF
jgi:hypothetical protein